MQVGDGARHYASPAFGEKGVSDDVSPHDRIGLPMGAQADECYGD